ncbi:hypothetical protein [Azospirillum thermophilum]|uniref:RNA polymerase subunit sigma-70 n=1 Tax=Azospirillum thermophilum TaxID=2202148 RepID=A0A2S2CQH7_9PROT|nr:hypothetical protein [Azospirillum thermophilum]AWK86630.1 hypothetical protein DEW08_10595 [Azospirillum thermophilum]
MATLKEFEEALKAAGNTEALAILESLRERDRASRSIRPARRVTGRKMTPELAAEILHLHQTTDMTQQEIAFQLGVNQGRVNEVIKRGKWLDGDPNAPEAVARDKALERAEQGVGFTPRAPRRKAGKKTEEVAASAEAAAEPPAAAGEPPAAAQAPEGKALPEEAKPQESLPEAGKPDDAEPSLLELAAAPIPEAAPEPVEEPTPEPVEPPEETKPTAAETAKPAAGEEAAPGRKPAKKRKKPGGPAQLLFEL